MKKIITSTVLSFIAAMALAIPAKRNWITVTQSDGTTLKVCLTGDEHTHFYVTSDNVPLYKDAENRFCYLKIEDGKLVSSNILAHEAERRTAKESIAITDITSISAYAEKKLTTRNTNIMKGIKRLPGKDDKSVFQGKKKAPVILAYFSDKSFSKDDESITAFYNDVLNKEGFSQYGAAGSVHDYFSVMSRGAFDLSFDVIGPVKVSKSATYYGGPSAIMGGTDHIGEFITEAIKNADAQYDIDWTKYDWDGDGEVEQVFVLYAGYGQATGGPTGTIWPNA